MASRGHLGFQGSGDFQINTQPLQQVCHAIISEYTHIIFTFSLGPTYNMESQQTHDVGTTSNIGRI